MGELKYYGAVTVGDMHAAFGYQVQAPVHLTDFLYAVPGEGYGALSGFKIDPVHECIYGAPLFVPSNQKIAQAGLAITDNDQNLLTGVPAVKWSSFVVTDTGTNAAMDPTKYAVQMFADRQWRHQYWDVQIIDETKASVAKLVARASTVTNDGSDVAMNVQAVTCLLSRNIFAGLTSSGSAYFILRVNVAGAIYAIKMGNLDFPVISKSLDSGVTYTEIRTDLKTGGSPLEFMGGTDPARVGNLVPIQACVMNGKLSLAVGGVSVPFVAEVGDNCSTGVVKTTHTTVTVATGDGAAFPPAPFDCQVWPGSVAPTNANMTTITVSAVTGDVFTVSAPVPKGYNLAILDPRINYIEFEARNFSQVGGQVHPTKWYSQPTLLSPATQIGYVPDASTPLAYSVLTGIETIDMPGGTATPLFPSGASVTITQTAGSVGTILSKYALNLTNPVKSGGGYASYGGTSYSHYTACLTRVVARTAGIINPPSAAFVTVPLGTGANIDIQAVSENISFDPAAMTIRHSMEVTFNNFKGISFLASKYGVTGSGNIAAGLSLGWQHQGGPGAYGFPRFYGYCQEFQFPRSSGGTAHLIMPCTDQMQQLADVYLSAPPNLDGMNHYFAVGLLAQMAGIPRSQMAFSAYIPTDPYGSVGIDPDPYFLPIGLGMHPWTPINRTLPTLELLDTIRKYSGFLLYFDANGLLRYELWVPQASGAPKRIFQEAAAYPYGADGSGGVVEMFNCTPVSSTKNVRNQVVLIGIDAFGTGGGIVVNQEDSASISSPPGSQPANYVGYRSPYVRMDSRFATVGFALKAQDRLFRFLRLPEYTVSFTTWMQPDLYPLDVIWVNDVKANTYGVPFVIMSMNTSQSVLSPGIPPSCTITARYLEPSLLQPL